MRKQEELTQEQEMLKERLIKASNVPCGFRYMCRNWPKNLWSKKTMDIYEFLERRFNNTDNEAEYYACMVYLRNVIPDIELLVEWRERQMSGKKTIFTDYRSGKIASPFALPSIVKTVEVL